MRVFKLTNALGQTYDLNDTDNFFHTPSGLGFTRSTSFTQIGDRFVPKTDKFSQKSITGNIRFKGHDEKAYERYAKFMAFIQHVPLTLFYSTDSASRIDVYPVSVNKGEISKIGLDVPITFKALCPFYKIVTSVATNAAGAGKVYDFSYDYKYADAVPGSVAIQSDSVKKSPVKMYIFGAAINPHWRHYVDGELVGEGRVNATIKEGDKLLIDSVSTPYAIQEVDELNRVVYDRYAESDFSTDRFLFMRRGKNVISVSHDGAGDLGLIVEARILHESV